MAPAAEPLPPVHHAKNFRVEIQGLANVTLGYFTQVTGFSSQVDVLEYPEGGRNDYVHRLPSRVKQGNITLKRGVITSEMTLIEWYVKTTQMSPGPQVTTLLIHLDDSETHRIRTWSFANAYPVKWTGGDLNAGGTEFLTESLEIAHNGMTVS
jgi:phage tail-like protein